MHEHANRAGIHLLAISTSTSAWSVWLHRADGWSRSVHADAGRGSGQRASLTRMVWGLLAEADLRPSDLQRVVCDVGPGSFTGLRQGLALARALAWAHQIPTQAAGSLRSMAMLQAPHLTPGQTLAVALPARADVDFVGVQAPSGWTERALAHADLHTWWREVRPDLIAVPHTDLHKPLAQWARDRGAPVNTAEPQAEVMGLWSLNQDGVRDELAPRYLAVSEAEHHAGVAVPEAAVPAVDRNACSHN